MPEYCTIADVKLARRGLPDVLDDLITALIPRASAAVEHYAATGRSFTLDTVASDRFFETTCREREVVIDALSAPPTEVELLTMDGTSVRTFTVADEIVTLPRNRPDDEPIRGLRLRTGYVSEYQELRVRGIWGWPAVPDDVVEATITAVVEWLKDGQGLTPQSPDPFEPGAPPTRALPLKSRGLLARFRPRMGLS